MQQSYELNRNIEVAARRILGARNAKGSFSSFGQLEAIEKARKEGIPFGELPDKPSDENDLFVATRYGLDEFGNKMAIRGVYREKFMQRVMDTDAKGNIIEKVVINNPVTGKPEAEALSYKVKEASDELEFVPHPSEKEAVQLRVVNPNEKDVRRWDLIEFGEPELVKQEALARFSLINAYFDKRRKEVALRNAKMDIIAEGIFAGLNIAGGLFAWGVPVGSIARLLYDIGRLASRPGTPNVKQMKEAFRLIAAKENNKALSRKPLKGAQ